MLLPYPDDEPAYWQTLYRQPVSFWQPALDTIRECHQLSDNVWQRASAGKNAVFLSDSLAVKLCPPFWMEDIVSEAKTVQMTYQRLPVATPELLGEGDLDDWYYLVLSRLPGEQMRTQWKSLSADEKADLARQHGELMAALHRLPAEDFSHILFDWKDMLEEQFAECYAAMQRQGVAAVLLDDLYPYLEPMMPKLLADTDIVPLHGDLDAVNMMVEQHDGQWLISGLFDWGDAKRGARNHEFISPSVHTYQGDKRSMQAWYEGYGLTPEMQTAELQHDIMARTMLYYAGGFARYLKAVPGAETCRSWREAAACFYHFHLMA